MQFSSRLNKFGDEIFAALDQLKERLINEGKTIYNLSIGTPDFEPPKHIIEALKTAADDPKNWKYSLHDLPELTQAVCEYYKRRFSVDINQNQVMSVYGSQEGMGHIGLALCDEGDTVLLPDPGYPVFTAGSLLGGAIPYYYPLKKENGFVPDLRDIPEEIACKAKYMIVSFPSNPVASGADEDFYISLVNFAKKHDILIIQDNAYSDIIFDGNEGRSFFNIEGAAEVGVEFFSLSKSYNVTGARMSFLIGREDVINAVRKIRSQIDFGMFIPIQKAAIAALNGSRESVVEQCRLYQERRDALCSGLRKIGWNVPNSKGSMFVWAPLPDGYSNSMQFCLELMEKTGVICTPGSSFGSEGEGCVRFALVLPPSEIEKAVESIKISGIIK